MSNLASLLEIQALDLAIDAARARSAELPGRTQHPVLVERMAGAEEAVAAARRARAELEARERTLGEAVGQIARDIEQAELARYSGKHKDREQAATHDASQQALRERQAALEEEEMTLLEEIEEIEAGLAEHEASIVRDRVEDQALLDEIRQVEAEVAAEIGGLEARRAELLPGLPARVLQAYERVRTQPRNRGRGATTIADTRCAACRIELPSIERRKMLDAPPDALIQCPQCRRVVVREALPVGADVT